MNFIKTAIVLSPLVIVLTSCSFLPDVQTGTLTPTDSVVFISTNIPELTDTQTATPVPEYTKTAQPSTVLNTKDGKLFISHKYGFSIILPTDSQSVVYNRNDLSEILIASFPEIELDDGGIISKVIHVWVEDQTDSCHAGLSNSDRGPIKMEQVTLGGISFNKIYTPELDKDDMQAIEFMTHGTNSCVHFFISLTTSYFDRGDAEPGNMLPYVQDELDDIISTFEWVKQ